MPAAAPTTLPCPFCADARPAELISETLIDEEKKIPEDFHHFECVCCGAQGPYANSEADARLLWNARFSGHSNQTSEEWRQYFREETS